MDVVARLAGIDDVEAIVHEVVGRAPHHHGALAASVSRNRKLPGTELDCVVCAPTT